MIWLTIFWGVKGAGAIERFAGAIERFAGAIERFAGAIEILFLEVGIKYGSSGVFKKDRSYNMYNSYNGDFHSVPSPFPPGVNNKFWLISESSER